MSRTKTEQVERLDNEVVNSIRFYMELILYLEATSSPLNYKETSLYKFLTRLKSHPRYCSDVVLSELISRAYQSIPLAFLRTIGMEDIESETMRTIDVSNSWIPKL